MREEAARRILVYKDVIDAPGGLTVGEVVLLITAIREHFLARNVTRM
jgi:hypothetical protein